MGCLNSEGNFKHWFGNIHLSGRCNRSCYFCIGQHMMSLDKHDVLNKFPLDGLDEFVKQCRDKYITEVNMTGSNTDPMLYQHTEKLKEYLRKGIPKLFFKINTNGVARNYKMFQLYDGGSISIPSFDGDIYKQMMGQGSPPSIDDIVYATKHWIDFKINIVLGDENVKTGDIYKTLELLEYYNIPKVNLREPYGQAHIGNPLGNKNHNGHIYGNPYYIYGSGMLVTYWDVHYTNVESVNLYANGIVSSTYPITKGHDPIDGKVIDQSKWGKGRQFEQWILIKGIKK